MSDHHAAAVQVEVGGDAIALVVLAPSAGVPAVLDEAAVDALVAAVDRVAADPAIRGVLVASATGGFGFGRDLARLLSIGEAATLDAMTRRVHAALRRLETCGKPAAAALGGSALGFGLEIALACHHRVAADRQDARFGFPEVGHGLIPGAGGTQRLPRLAGIEAALPLLLEARLIDAADARARGIVDALVAPGAELQAAREWLHRATADAAQQPWDRKGWRQPGGAVASPAMQQFFAAANAKLRRRTFGNLPHLVSALSCVYEGLLTGIDAGLAVERRYFVHALLSAEARAMLRTLVWGVPQARALVADAYERRLADAYRGEGLALRAEGVAPVLVHNAGLMAGMRDAPLPAQAGIDDAPAPQAAASGPAAAATALQPDVQSVIDRLLVAVCLEAVRCLDDGVVRTPIEADVWAVVGAGFPAFRGGPTAEIDRRGAASFVARCRELAARHGARFEPPARLVEMAGRGATFHAH